MTYCRPYYSQESRKANEKFVMDCHYSICDTYGGCRGVTSKLNLSLHLTAFVFWNTYFSPGDHNTNRIPTFSKPTPRELNLNKEGFFSLLTVRKELPFRFSRAAKRQGVLDRIFLFVLIEDCVFWPKATWKPWEKTVDPLLLLLLLLLPLSSQYWLSQIALRDCFFFYDSDMYGNSYYSYVELSISKACSDTWKSWI